MRTQIATQRIWDFNTCNDLHNYVLLILYPRGTSSPPSINGATLLVLVEIVVDLLRNVLLTFGPRFVLRFVFPDLDYLWRNHVTIINSGHLAVTKNDVHLTFDPRLILPDLDYPWPNHVSTINSGHLVVTKNDVLLTWHKRTYKQTNNFFHMTLSTVEGIIKSKTLLKKLKREVLIWPFPTYFACIFIKVIVLLLCFTPLFCLFR